MRSFQKTKGKEQEKQIDPDWKIRNVSTLKDNYFQLAEF